MKNKPFALRSGMYRLVFLLGLIPILTGSCNDKKEAGYAHQLRFITEDYKPFNYVESDQLKGLAPEILEEICNGLSIPFEAEVMAWPDAYAAAQSDPEAVLFSAILNEERKDLFKWVGPVASLDWRFYSASNNPLGITSLADAREVDGIGVIQDFSIEQFLLGEGFTNLVYCTNSEEAFQKLLNGEISLVPSSQITAEAALESIGRSIYEVTPKLTIQTDFVYIAFNKAIPDVVVADFQYQLNLMKTNGRLQNLYQTYMQSTEAPGIIQFYTEHYPPLTFRNSYGEISGFGTDIVREVMKRNQSFHEIKLSLWSNGYNLALHQPNFCLFTMDRTPIREDLFQWVGPIGTNTTFFYIKNGSGITIDKLEDARALNSVGTVSSWFSDQYLRELGFTNLNAQDDPASMIELLMNGEIDAAVCTNVTIADILDDAGYQYDMISPIFDLLSSDYYIAFSKSTHPTIVMQWQQAVDQAKADGTYQSIYSKWFPE